MRKSNRHLFLLHTVLAIATVATTSSAQSPGNPMSPSNPATTGSQLDNQKETLYAQFTDYRRNPNPEQQRYAYPAAKDYLRRFGGDKDAETKEVWKFVTEYERAIHQPELFAAYNSKNYAKTFELGRTLLKNDPENFFALGIMSEAGYDSAVAGNTSLNVETIECLRSAVKLLDDGKVTKADPFRNLELARGFLNFALGWFVKDEKPVEAAAAFLKAVRSDSPYQTDPSAYHRLGVAIIKGEFAQLSAEYNERFGAKPPSMEQEAMFRKVLNLADRAIDAYARAVALSTKPEQQDARGKILAQLTALYKNFHNGSDAGLNELIAGVLSRPIP